MFANEERPKIRAANPDFGIGEIGKELGRLWGKMSAAEKKPFEALAKKDKARYEKEMEEYMAGGGGAKAPAAKKKKKNESSDEEESEEEESD